MNRPRAASGNARQLIIFQMNTYPSQATSSRRGRPAACAIALAALLVCTGATARAAIVSDAQSTSFANGPALVFPHTVGIGINRVLVVGVSTYSANKTVTSLTYGGAPLTRLGFLDGGSGSNDRRMEMWLRVDPPIGTADVVVTMSGGAKVVAGAASFFGVDALAPTGGFVSNEGSSNLASVVVPSAAGELVLDVLSVAGDAATAGVGADQSQMWNLWSQSNPGSVVGAASIEPGAAAVTMSWNLATSTYWVLGAVSLKPAPPAPFLAMTKNVDLAAAIPGQDINYTVVASSAGGLSDATGIVVVDSIPDYAGFRIGSATFDAGTTTLTSFVTYSSDDGTTWNYLPGSGSCTAPAGYDYCVTHVRWTLAGVMPPSLSFQLGMTVRVK